MNNETTPLTPAERAREVMILCRIEGEIDWRLGVSADVLYKRIYEQIEEATKDTDSTISGLRTQLAEDRERMKRWERVVRAAIKYDLLNLAALAVAWLEELET